MIQNQDRLHHVPIRFGFCGMLDARFGVFINMTALMRQV
jgi:hypothetical protein